MLDHDRTETLSDAAYLRAMEHLLGVIGELSTARHLASIQQIVSRAARTLTGCDGATFVLLEDGQCYYAAEDAIAPLWRGKRFSLDVCASGWVMRNRCPAIIPDIYADDRIPQDAYRVTFVKSLVLVPVRRSDPLAAIGNYWASPHAASPREVALLQALADATALALENAQLYTDVNRLVRGGVV